MKKLLLLLLLSVTPCIFGLIVEHKEFAALLNYLNAEDFHSKTLVLLDIDNTLAQPKNLLIGSDQFAYYLVTQKMKEGYTSDQSWQAVCPLYFAIQHAIDLEPVELTTPRIIKQLQDAGLTVIALTARSLEIRERTIDQLKDIAIDLSLSGLSPCEIISEIKQIYHYKKGIIFCAGHEKGKILADILERAHYSPTKVIFIDDKEKYLHVVQQALAPTIEFVGIRYSYLDEKVAAFDAAVAEKELLEFLKNHPFEHAIA